MIIKLSRNNTEKEQEREEEQINNMFESLVVPQIVCDFFMGITKCVLIVTVWANSYGQLFHHFSISHTIVLLHR